MRSIVFTIAVFQFVIFVKWFFMWLTTLCRANFFLRKFEYVASVSMLNSVPYIALMRPIYVFFILSLYLRHWIDILNNGSRCMTLNGFYGQLFCQRVIRNGNGKIYRGFVTVLLLTEFSPASVKMNDCKHVYSFHFVCSIPFYFVPFVVVLFFFHSSLWCSIFSSFLLSCLLSIQQQNHLLTS